MKKELILFDKIYDLSSLTPVQIQKAVQGDLDFIYGKDMVLFSMNTNEQDKTVELGYQRSGETYDGTEKESYVDREDLNMWLGADTRCNIGLTSPYGNMYKASFHEDDVCEFYKYSAKTLGYSKPKGITFSADDKHFNVKMQF